MSTALIIAQTIKVIAYLEHYFISHYIDPNNNEDNEAFKNANKYATKALELLSLYDTREEQRDFEYLFFQSNEKDFAKVLESLWFIDQIVPLFESR